ncbi:MAG: NADH-quinone oxidoreductase subunit C [Thermoleophilia bacterium]
MSGLVAPEGFDAPTVERVSPARWRTAVQRALEEGARPAGLHGADGEGGPEARLLLDREGVLSLLVCPAVDGGVPTLVDLAPALNWDERELHDVRGVRAVGHEPLRPLVDHDLDLERWTVPVHGEGPYQVAVGPIHAGVIESGHFRFHLVGERILHLDARLFYKHRGLERLAEGRTAADGLAVARRACAACAVTNAVAYAQAAESALGLWPDPMLRDVRTLLLELERLYNHLHDIGQLCAGVGFAAGAMAFAALKERAQRLNLRLAGHRFLFDSVAIGATPFRLERVDARVARDELRALRLDARRAWRVVLFNSSVQDRLDGVGVVTREDALRIGTVGPAGRASGVARDARQHAPRLSYEGFVPAAPAAANGDVQTRLELRALELETTFDLFDALLARPLDGGTAVPAADPAPLGAAVVESPRGATACVLELADGAVRRFSLRTGSYANWPSAAFCAPGNLLPDFPLINKSFELCYACADR